jgi:alanine-alpha-ketoisovalerate/valine-pyruvate aminotransferase
MTNDGKEKGKDRQSFSKRIAAMIAIAAWTSGQIGGAIATSEGFQKSLETVTQTVMREYYLNATKK